MNRIQLRRTVPGFDQAWLGLGLLLSLPVFPAACGLQSRAVDLRSSELPRAAQEPDAGSDLREVLKQAGVKLDQGAGLVSLPVRVLVRDELLEYLLVGPRGQGHESLFTTDVRPSHLNAGLLALGVEPGSNARWDEPVLDKTSLDEPDLDETGLNEAGAEPQLHLPEGDGLYVYAAWRERDETYLFRVDDLLSNLRTGRSMPRHRWVFLGSRFSRPRADQPEVFVADYEENLINISFFFQGNTLLTPALEECMEQTVWVANSWLVPPRDQIIDLIFARQPIRTLPPGWEAELPVLALAGERDGERAVEQEGAVGGD